MKSFIKEYLEVLIYTICGILIIIGSYNIIININHAKYLNEKIVVREMDTDYKEYKNNVLELESNLEKSNKSSVLYSTLDKALKIMKTNGVYRLLPGDVLGYQEVYNLNNYFLDTIINDSWVSGIKLLNNNTIDNSYVNTLINNANFMNKELLNNSNYQYDIRKNDIRNTLDEEYHLVVSNYRDYSTLLVELSENLGD